MSQLQQKAQKLGIIIPDINSEQINEQIKPVLRKMEQNGIRLDCDSLRSLDNKLSSRLKELEQDIYKEVGLEFNIGSPIQMAEVLFEKLKLPVDGLKKTKSGISTAASELKKIENEHPVIPLILEQRELSKLISTYLKPLPLLIDENSRLHTTYGLETSTGRLTSSEPNLQNIPIKGKYGNDIRAAFVATPGMNLIVSDYSQIELRIIACIAKDDNMIKAFSEGIDIHAKTASEIFNIPVEKVTKDHRRIAKAVNFGIAYGQTPFGLSQALGISTENAARYIRDYFDAHKGIKSYINDIINIAHDQGYVETLFGTRRYLPEINSRMRFLAEAEERAAINTPIQGTAAEILKLAMIELDRKLANYCHPEFISGSIEKKMLKQVQHDTTCVRMLLTVHDELVIEAPKEISAEISDIVKNTMENIIKACVPIEVNIGIGQNWAESK